MMISSSNGTTVQQTVIGTTTEELAITDKTNAQAQEEILDTTSSHELWRDGDGDIAHEFWEETSAQGGYGACL